MDENDRWEYRHSFVTWELLERGGTTHGDEMMKKWTDDGWELHSAMTSPFVIVGGGGGGFGGISINVESKPFVFCWALWRRRCTPEQNSA